MWNVCKNLYEIPEISEINRLPMHGAEIPFPNAERVKFCDYSASEYFLSLDGMWKFQLFHSPEEVPEKVFSPRFRDTKWREIPVPSNWTLQNQFDKPVYTNIQMPFVNNPPAVPENNPTGIYRTIFTLPAEWDKKRIVLHIGGAESYLEVYCNGKFIGMGKDCRLPSEFDLTDAIHYGETNTLVCKVIRWSDSSYIEDQDQWWMAGLYRSIYLYCTNSVYIEDLYAEGDLDLQNGDGLLTVKTHLGFQLPAWLNTAEHPAIVMGHGPVENFVLRTVLRDSTGKTLWKNTAQADCRFRVSCYEEEQQARIPEIQFWSAETPVLYFLTVELLDAAGTVLECRAKRIGFRNICLRGSDLLINGKRVMIRGVNRHEHDCRTGKTLSLETMLQDIRLLKQFNFNAVRTCHYPDDHRWYDLCDEYGIYILDEANVETHANYSNLCREPRWKHAFVSRVERMILRDRSHTCIFGWSMGNESGHGENLLAALKRARELDKLRIMHHEGETRDTWHQGSPWVYNAVDPDRNALFDPMYPPLDEVEKFAASNPNRPLVLCEYAHAMGNSSGSLCDYWDLFWSKPALQGGFIWDWVDQGLVKTDDNGTEYFAYGGDFGEPIHDFDFCCNGMLASDRTPHPAMYEFRHLVQPVKVETADKSFRNFRLTNRREFTDLSDLCGKWTLQVNGEIIAEGTLCGFEETAPGQTMDFSIPELDEYQQTPGECFVNFRFVLKNTTPWAEAGTLLAHDQLAIVFAPTEEYAVHKVSPVLSGVHLMDSDKTLLFYAAGLTLAIDRKNGLGTLCKGKDVVLRKLFECNLFRAATDNDGIRGWTGQENKPMGKWLAAGLHKLQLNDLTIGVAADGENFTVTLDKSYVGKDPEAVVKFLQTVRIYADGHFTFKQEYFLPENFPSMPRIGVSAWTGKGFEDLVYYGRGPWENYSDRCRSAEVGLYKMTVSEMFEKGYVLPQENGNRTGVRYLELSSADAVLHISSSRPFEFTASHHTPNDLFKAFHTNELTEHPETILLLDYAQRGLGTGSCGPQTLEKYQLNEKYYCFEFSLEVR